MSELRDEGFQMAKTVFKNSWEMMVLMSEWVENPQQSEMDIPKLRSGIISTETF